MTRGMFREVKVRLRNLKTLYQQSRMVVVVSWSGAVSGTATLHKVDEIMKQEDSTYVDLEVIWTQLGVPTEH